MKPSKSVFLLLKPFLKRVILCFSFRYHTMSEVAQPANLEKISSIKVVAGPSTVHGSDKVMPDTIDKYNPNSNKYKKVICAKDTSEL